MSLWNRRLVGLAESVCACVGLVWSGLVWSSFAAQHTVCLSRGVGGGGSFYFIRLFTSIHLPAFFLCQELSLGQPVYKDLIMKMSLFPHWLCSISSNSCAVKQLRPKHVVGTLWSGRWLLLTVHVLDNMLYQLILTFGQWRHIAGRQGHFAHLTCHPVHITIFVTLEMPSAWENAERGGNGIVVLQCVLFWYETWSLTLIKEIELWLTKVTVRIVP
jgi:hypothetical protein